jgi:elongator complex protein 1
MYPINCSEFCLTQYLRRSQLPAEVIANVCDSVRQDLEDRNLTKYVNSILTAYVVKSPPDHEAGLTLLLHLRGTFS